MDPVRVIRTLVAAAFVIGMSACDQKPSAEQVGRKIDRAVEKMEPKVEKAAQTVREKTAVAVEKVDDVTLSARVKTALIAEPGVKARDVKVDSKDGVVAIYGKAESAEQKELAAKVVGAVNGVKSVDNRLVVAGS
jgi:hyperosmotically inducible protein